jgi:hypothetical protein
VGLNQAHHRNNCGAQYMRCGVNFVHGPPARQVPGVTQATRTSSADKISDSTTDWRPLAARTPARRCG